MQLANVLKHPAMLYERCHGVLVAVVRSLTGRTLALRVHLWIRLPELASYLTAAGLRDPRSAELHTALGR